MKSVISVILVLWFCALTFGLQAQSDSANNIFVEISVDPVKPLDLRGSIGYCFDEQKVDLQVSYEYYYKKLGDHSYKSIDLSLCYYLVNDYLIANKAFDLGFGGRAGWANHDMASAAFLKSTLALSEHFKIGLYANYCTSARWDAYAEGRIMASYNF